MVNVHWMRNQLQISLILGQKSGHLKSGIYRSLIFFCTRILECRSFKHAKGYFHYIQEVRHARP